jgi:hypothetical protein
MANSGDLNAHQKTYSSFTTLVKWGTILTGIVTFAVVLIVAN